MEFQIAEAIELIKTLAETENLTQSEALTTFVAEAGLDIEYASQLKAALYETYTLQEMASDALTKALYNVFVSGGTGAEDIQEVDTKETQEGTKYKVRVQDKASGSSYTRYATREKIAQLRANPNISSVELSDYGSDEDSDGQRTAAAKRGDRDGDGKVESGSKEHAGVVHNAIQRAKGGNPDGQDTRKEETLWSRYLALREGKKQGYNDRLDDALGAKHGKKKQSEKDRRDESEGMEKHDDKRKYAGDHSMDESRQGYNDRLDDALGSRHGKKKQSLKDRRDESEGMEKHDGKRKFSGDKSMDESRQGYNDRLDDALGARHGKKKQSEKDRRDESEGMEKHDGKRKFSGDKSMDESAQGYNDRLDDALGARHGKKKQSLKDRRDESEGMEKKDGKHKFAGDKSMKESVAKDEKEAKHDEKLASKDEREAAYDTKKGKSKRAKELDDDAKQDDADAAVDVRRESNSWTAYLALREAKKSKAEKEKAAKDGHAVALYKDQWKDRKIADYDKEHGKDERAKEMRADAGEDRKRMKELDPDWKHAKYATGEEKGKKNYTDKSKKKVDEEVFIEADIIDAGRQNQGERENKKLDGKGVDNSDRIHLMPKMREETIVTSTATASSMSKLQQESSSKRATLAALAEKMGVDLDHEKEEKKEQKDRDKIRKMLDKEDEAEGKKDKCETVELDDAGMPIMEYDRNMANGPKKDDVDPPADANGERGYFNPKGKPKRPRGGDRRPNAKGGPDLPFDDGTVPNGAGV